MEPDSLLFMVKKKITSSKKAKRRNSFWNPFSKKIMNQHEVKVSLEELHNDYVLTPTDKASQNIAIICKSFYIHTLIKEVKNNRTYKMINEPLDTILSRHEKEIKNFGLENNQKQFPYLMWTPKLHKLPSKQRFIAISFSCTTKVVSQLITTCLKLIERANFSYCQRILSYTGFNFMWIINNSQQIFAKMKGKIRNLKTYDFSTLYTSILHAKLLKE